LAVLKERYGHYIDVLDKKINGDVDGKNSEYGDTYIQENNQQNHDTLETVEQSAIMMDQILAAESSDAPDNDDEYIDDSFVVINRQAEYLKQSTIDYIESQELNALMTAIDIDRWSDYTDQKISVAPLSSSSHPTSLKLARTDKVVGDRSANGSKINTLNGQKKEQKFSVIRRPIKDCGFIWPIDADRFWLSSLFGPRKRIDGTWGFHHGIDMAAVKGTPVKAVTAGAVVEASFQTGYGNTVVIKHCQAVTTRYAHLHSIRVYVGQKVKQTSIIGTVGETGFIRKKGKDGSHLHFEVYEGGKRINPLHCLPRMT
jgi:murein DD-endopeptidase MepM/ murein hydrolase activator NlpD